MIYTILVFIWFLFGGLGAAAFIFDATEIFRGNMVKKITLKDLFCALACVFFAIFMVLLGPISFFACVMAYGDRIIIWERRP